MPFSLIASARAHQGHALAFGFGLALIRSHRGDWTGGRRALADDRLGGTLLSDRDRSVLRRDARAVHP